VNGRRKDRTVSNVASQEGGDNGRSNPSKTEKGSNKEKGRAGLREKTCHCGYKPGTGKRKSAGSGDSAWKKNTARTDGGWIGKKVGRETAIPKRRRPCLKVRTDHLKVVQQGESLRKDSESCHFWIKDPKEKD